MNTVYENGVTVMTNGTVVTDSTGTTDGSEPHAEVADAPPAEVTVVDVAPETAPAPTSASAPAPVSEPAAPAQTAAPTAQTEPTEGSTEEETPPAPIVRHNQDIGQQRQLVELRGLVAGAESAPEPLRSLLEAHGINSAYLIARRSECDAMDATFATRRQSMAAKNLAVQQQTQAETFARSTYSALRMVGRTVLRNPAEQIAMGFDERTPADTDLFIATARHTVAAAKQEPYASRLAGSTLGMDRLEAMEGALDALTTLMQMRQAAEQAAIEATRARNAMAAEVRRAVRQLRVEIGLILRQHPEITPPVWF